MIYIDYAREKERQKKHNNRENYIREKMAEFAMDIDKFQINQSITDSDGSKCIITNKTANTIQVYISKKTKHGINTTQWFDMRSFHRRFKVL